MTRLSAPSLREFPHDLVRVACEKCGRSGQLRKDRLIEVHGADITMPDLRHLIADCPRRLSMIDPCGIYYPDLAHG
jgi:hypothetical protein